MYPTSQTYFSSENIDLPPWGPFRSTMSPVNPAQSLRRGASLDSSPGMRYDTLRDPMWSSVYPDVTQRPLSIPWSAQMQLWYYLDPSSTMQGPFPATSMQAWYEQNYLYPDLLVRPDDDAQFRPLHAYVAEIGDPVRPFLIPPKRVGRPSSASAPTPPNIPSSVPGSPHVSATNSPQLVHASPQLDPSVRATDHLRQNSAVAAAVTSANAPSTTATTMSSNASNLSADDILTALRVMSQLQALMPNSTETQTLQMMQNVLATSVPHANEAGLNDILHAMQRQAASDAFRASQARAYADAEYPVHASSMPTSSSSSVHNDTNWPYNHDQDLSLYSDEDDDPFSPEPKRGSNAPKQIPTVLPDASALRAPVAKPLEQAHPDHAGSIGTPSGQADTSETVAALGESTTATIAAQNPDLPAHDSMPGSDTISNPVSNSNPIDPKSTLPPKPAFLSKPQLPSGLESVESSQNSEPSRGLAKDILPSTDPTPSHKAASHMESSTQVYSSSQVPEPSKALQAVSPSKAPKSDKALDAKPIPTSDSRATEADAAVSASVNVPPYSSVRKSSTATGLSGDSTGSDGSRGLASSSLTSDSGTPTPSDPSTGSTSTSSSSATPKPASVRPAPWASASAKPAQASTPNMREILEAEQRERKAREAKERAKNSAMLASAMASMHMSQPTLTSSSSTTGGTVSTAATTPRSTGVAWNVPKSTTPAKSLSQIQQEESARSASEKAAHAQVARSSASRAPGEPDSPNEAGWVKVGSSGGKAHALPPKPVAAVKNSAGGSGQGNNNSNNSGAGAPKSSLTQVRASLPNRPPALSSSGLGSAVTTSSSAVPSEADEDGWVTMKPKHQARRDALSQMNDSIPRPNGSAAGSAGSASSATRSSTSTMVPSSTPQPPSPEFVKYCRDQLKGLRANIDDFIEMLLSFPLNPSPDVTVIIAEAVYANSSTLDGRRFAADFVTRRKADAYRAVTI